jgi:hypothetical protein
VTNVVAMNVTPGQNITIGIDRVTAGAKALAGVYDITMPSGWSIVSGANFASGTSKDTIVLQVPDSYAKFNFDLTITPVGSDGTRYKAMTIPTVNIDNSLVVETYPVLNQSRNGWNVAVALKNTRTSGTLDGGNIELLAPASVAGSYAFEPIPAGETQVVLIPASILSIMELTEFTFHITREDGYDRTISKKLSSLTATRTNADVPISPDGILQPDEWKGALEVQLGEKQYVASGSTPWGGMNDHSALQYVKWDNENLYLAVEVTDDVHSMEVADVYGSWGSDSLQLSFDPLRAAGYGPDSNHIRFIASYNANTNASALGVESWGPITGANLNDIHYKFTRYEVSKKTIYELALPWKTILTADRLPAKADLTDLGISVLVNDNDTNGREGWLKYMDGIATGKDPSRFGDLILSDLTDLSRLTQENTPPVIETIDTKAVNEGEKLEFTVNASDADNDSLNYSTGTLPDGAAFNAETRVFTWTPGYDQAGSYKVHFDATDGTMTGGIDVTINVSNVKAQVLTEKLNSYINGLKINKITENQLANEIGSVTSDLNKEKYKQAMIKLKVFMLEVKILEPKVLTNDQANYILDACLDICTAIQYDAQGKDESWLDSKVTSLLDQIKKFKSGKAMDTFDSIINCIDDLTNKMK